MDRLTAQSVGPVAMVEGGDEGKLGKERLTVPLLYSPCPTFYNYTGLESCETVGGSYVMRLQI